MKRRSLLALLCATALTSLLHVQPAAAQAVTSLVKMEEKIGTGKTAATGQSVSVHYTGWLYNAGAKGNKGKQFDTSRERGKPFSFTLGAGSVIAGWDQGVVGMKVGGKRTLIIPASLGYGASGAGNGVIPPNATLLFEVELLDVK